MRRTYSAWLFAVLISYAAILPLLFGVLGLPGNSLITAGFIVGTIGLLFVASVDAGFRPTLPDSLFVGLCIAISLSFGLTKRSADGREIVLLALSLSSYVAARVIPLDQLPALSKTCFLVSLAIVVVGSGFSLAAVIQQWNNLHGKPYVFGFDHAPILFTQALGVLIIAFSCSDFSRRASIATILVIMLASLIFAISMVRATFLSIVIALIASALLHPSKSVRTRLLSGVAVLGALIVIGLVLRHERAWVFARYIIEKTPLIASSLGRPSCGLAINLDNSIAIREALLRDAIYLLPDSGLFGLGLDGYMVGSCLPNTQAHNVVVQAVVEFGFVGGGLFVGLIIACLLFPLAQASRNPQARFVFCCGVFYLAESCFHGRISRDIELFAFLGVAARFSDGPLRVKLRQRAAATAG